MAGLTGSPATTARSEAPLPRTSTSWALVHTAALSVAACALLLLGALTGRFVLAGLLVPLQVLLALAWLAALTVPSLWPSAVLVTGSAIAADMLAATGPLGVRRLAGVIAVALLVSMLQQLLRRDGRVRLTAALAATVAAVVLVAGLAVLVALRRTTAGEDAVVAALLGTGVALLLARVVDAVRARIHPGVGRRRSVTGLAIAGAAAVGLGALVGALASSLGVGDGIALATAAAVVALAADIGIDIAAAGLPPVPEADRARAAMLPLAVLLPVSVAAPAAYVTGRVLLG